MVKLKVRIKHYKILTKTVEVNHCDWEHKLTVALWAYQTAYKVMMHYINMFCDASFGQKMNKDKIGVCFSRNLHFSRVLSLSQSICVDLIGDMGKYLGIPLIH